MTQEIVKLRPKDQFCTVTICLTRDESGIIVKSEVTNVDFDFYNNVIDYDEKGNPINAI